MRKFLSSLLILTVALCFIVAAPLAAQSAGTPAPLTLRILYGWTDHEPFVKELAEMYTAENPHVSFEFISGTPGELLPAMVQQRDYPDISLIPDGFDALYGNQGLLLDLSDRPVIARSTADNLATHTVDGKIYSISTGAGVYGIYYNKAHFAQAGVDKEPTTMPELKDAVAKLNAAGITPFIGGFKDSWPQGQYLRWGGAGVFTRNAPLTTDIGEKNKKFNDPDVVSLFDDIFELIDLIKDNMTDDSLLMTTGEAEVKFGQGEAAMYMLGDWSMATMETGNPDAAKRDVTGFMPIITSDDAADNRYLVFFNAGHGIFKDSKNLEEAIKFYDYLFSKESSDFVYRGLGAPGPFVDSDTSFANEFKQDMFAQITKPDRTWNDMEFLKLPPIFAGLDVAMDGYMKGAFSKAQVFDELQKAVEMALAVQ